MTEDRALDDRLVTLLNRTASVPANELGRVVDIVAECLGASSGRVLVVDYGLTTLQELGQDGPTVEHQRVDGTLPGRAFIRGEVVASVDDPVVWIPLTEGTERLGVLELTHPEWTDADEAACGPIVRVLTLFLVANRRYTDLFARSRRARPLSPAAEMQWDLLPPLSCAGERVSIAGLLEPAYDIGGDSFDYALNPDRLDIGIVDAVGHGLGSVMMAVAAINGLRNARREGAGIEDAYLSTGDLIEQQFGDTNFVTGQLASLSLATGELSWLNAGHPLPLLVRGGAYVGELPCRPSLPMGLGGSVAEVATIKLQPGDRVLFHTDGVSETRAPDGETFGIPRLADQLVRATLDRTAIAETVRHLGTAVMTYNSAVLSDDATLVLVEYRGRDASD